MSWSSAGSNVACPTIKTTKDVPIVQPVYAELGEVIAGKKAGRTSDEEIIIFDSTGTALQDLAAAIVYERAVSAGMGVMLNLGE